MDAGIGGAIISAGHAVPGAHGTAGEFGHMPFGDPGLRCLCGAPGCWNTSLNGHALARALHEPPPQDEVSYLRGILRALGEIARSLGRGVAGLVNAFDPHIVTCGGLGRDLLEVAGEYAAPAYLAGLMTYRGPPPPLVPARLGDEAPLVGAAEEAFARTITDEGLRCWSARQPSGGRRSRRRTRQGQQPSREGPKDLIDMHAVLLDMDGTLVDSDAAVERAWQTWADEYDVDLESAPPIAHGSPAIRNVRRLRPDLPEQAATAAADRQLALQYDDVSDVTAAPGAHELIAELNRIGMPWAVVTSADAKLAKVRLAAAGMRPPLLVTAEDVRAGKPDPEGYLQAASRLGADPGHCLVVEDAEAGVAAGRAAGATVASLKGVPGDIQLIDLHQLTRLLIAGPEK